MTNTVTNTTTETELGGDDREQKKGADFTDRLCNQPTTLRPSPLHPVFGAAVAVLDMGTAVVIVSVQESPHFTFYRLSWAVITCKV